MYSSLQGILDRAFAQASRGKGADRHANGEPFEKQPIMRIAQSVGLGFPAGQALKKIEEASGCWEEHPDRAVADLLGAINYVAAAILYIELKHQEGPL